VELDRAHGDRTVTDDGVNVNHGGSTERCDTGFDLTGVATLIDPTDADRQTTDGASDELSNTDALIAEIQTRSKARHAVRPVDDESYNDITDSELTDDETDTELSDTTAADGDADETQAIRELSDIDVSDIDVGHEDLRAKVTSETAEKFRTEQRSDPTLKAC